MRIHLTALFAGLALATSPATAAPGTTSEIVIDAGSGATLFATRADRARPPASLAKMMTLLLVFDALRDGKLTMASRIVMTPQGARQPPSRLGLARGGSLPLRSAIRALAVISANDVAVALAGRVAGSEAAFVRRMNARARAIGMRDTRFGNATGLSPDAGTTTARDIAILSRYLIRHYPARYGTFATRSIRWNGVTRPNHNRLLGKVRGLDGIKTGYTVAAGFNLAASSRRGSRRVIVVVMGERSVAARDLLVANLVEVGFSAPRRR